MRDVSTQQLIDCSGINAETPQRFETYTFTSSSLQIPEDGENGCGISVGCGSRGVRADCLLPVMSMAPVTPAKI